MYFLAALSLGFLGSLHCVGMCGPIALALPINQQSFFKKIVGVFTYNFGRVFTYSIMGLLFGLIGQAFAFALSQSILSIASGVFILLLVVLHKADIHLAPSNIIHKLLEKLKSKIRTLFGIQSSKALFFIGVLNGLLPCGLVYMGITGSIATGNILKGGLFMAGFGLGTIPAMSVLMFSKNVFTVSFRQKIRKAVPVFVTIMACLLILRGLNLGIPYVSPVTNVSGEIQPCCKK